MQFHQPKKFFKFCDVIFPYKGHLRSKVKVLPKCSFINLKSFFKFCDVIFPYKGHLRSKVKVSNESPVMTSYLKLIVTVCLSGTVFKILALLTTCSLS